MLRVENVSVQFGKAQILSEITVDFEPGKIIALCGPNGARQHL